MLLLLLPFLRLLCSVARSFFCRSCSCVLSFFLSAEGFLLCFFGSVMSFFVGAGGGAGGFVEFLLLLGVERTSMLVYGCVGGAVSERSDLCSVGLYLLLEGLKSGIIGADSIRVLQRWCYRRHWWLAEWPGTGHLW